MYRGTTPTLKIKVPYTATQMKSGYVTLKQETRNSTTQLDIPLDDDRITVEDNYIYVLLGQKDTLEFEGDKTVKLQVRLLIGDDEIAVASNIMNAHINSILKDGEI